MAKSLRSKWKRKCRAVKRERYAAKELERLKKTLGIDENKPKDVDMLDIAEIATIVDKKKMKDETKAKQNTAVTSEEKMEVEGVRVYNKRTMLDQYGNYPVWMNHRKISKFKKGRGKTEKATTKPGKRLTRRQKKKQKQR